MQQNLQTFLIEILILDPVVYVHKPIFFKWKPQLALLYTELRNYVHYCVYFQ